MTEDILRISGLNTRFYTKEGQVNAVTDVDLEIERGDVFGIVGESGSGKTVTALSIMDLIESPGEITAGSIEYRNESLAEAVHDTHPEAVDGDFVDLLQIPDDTRRWLRGTEFATIFQDPESSFNPTLTVGEQLAEAVEVQRRASSTPRLDRSRAEGQEYTFKNLLLSPIRSRDRFISKESRARAVELLEMVGIPDPVQRAEEYPHEFSGGMLQRAMIAQAVAAEPDLLIADEPTTALDVTIQAQVLELLTEMQERTGMTILLITHNLGVIARMCDKVGVMYAGEIVEKGTLEDLFERPIHPYTRGLIGSIPDIEGTQNRLQPIPGNVPNLLDHEMTDRCYFADRCPKAMWMCLDKPPMYPIENGDAQYSRCHLAEVPFDESEAIHSGYFDQSDQDDRIEAQTDGEALAVDRRSGGER